MLRSELPLAIGDEDERVLWVEMLPVRARERACESVRKLVTQALEGCRPGSSLGGCPGTACPPGACQAWQAGRSVPTWVLAPG
jgi:hypothetical protein